MTLLAKLDAIAVHAKAAAIAAGGATFYDAQVGFPASKGPNVRVFYGGEADSPHFPEDLTLTSQIVGQRIIVRGYWPLSETATKRHRAIEGEMATFIKELRTRVLGDSDLGGESTDLVMLHSTTEQIVVATIAYAITNTEILTDFDEYTRAK